MLDTEPVDAAETTLELHMHAGRNEKANKNCLLFVLQNKVPHYCSIEQRHVAMLLQLECYFNVYRHCYGNHKCVKM